MDYMSKRSMRIAGAVLAIIGMIFFSLIPLTMTPGRFGNMSSANPVNAFIVGAICVCGAVFFFRNQPSNRMYLNWDPQDDSGEGVSQRQFSYVDPVGGIGGPVTRAELIGLIRMGKITPTTPVWDDLRSKGWNGRWKPAWIALGIPREPAKLGDFDAWHQSS